jgi:pimeloyl-ACP methyl ester carboxylesterase
MPRVSAAPRADRTVALADGRLLAYSEWGDLQGWPVVLLHGWNGSRLFCPDVSATEAAGARLITIDRPGFGRSDPKPGRSVLDWVDDYVALAQHLNLPPAPVIGWSGGGPYALACAARIPERVTKVGVAATDGPWDEVPGAMNDLPSELRALVELLPRDPVAAEDGIRKRCQWYADDWSAMFAGVGSHPGDPDDELLTKPEIIGAVKTWMAEGARQGSAGYSSDVIAEFRPWGLSLSEITTAVVVWWGEADRLVTMAHARYLASAIPHATLVTFPGEGHLFPVTHWAEMLAAVGVSEGTSQPTS